MTFNPYAPPETSPTDETGTGDAGAGIPQPWGVDEVLRASWERVKADWPTLVFAPLLVMGVAQIVNMIPNQIIQRTGLSPLSKQAWAIMLAGILIGTFVQTYFQGGLLRLVLDAARGKSPSFSQLFSGGSVYLPLLGANLLMGLAVTAGFVLLLIPGIILALGFAMAPYYVVDAQMGPIAALNASWNAMRGHKAQLFLFGLAGFALMLVSMCTCVGWILVYAVLYVAYAIIYTRVSGRMAEPASPYGPPGGYTSSGGFSAGPMPPPGGGWGAA